MAQYLDTGGGDRAHCIGSWMEKAFADGIREFRTQVGYYRFSAIEPFETVLRGKAKAGAAVHFVVGANRGALSSTDLERTLSIVEGTQNGSLVVVSYSNALFHPKCIHIKTDSGTVLAIVGSGNMTEGGMGKNIEASVVLDEKDGEVIEQIELAIDKWRNIEADGVFLIQSVEDIRQLATDHIIDIPQAEPTIPRPPRNTARRLGILPRLWTPRRKMPRKRPAPMVVASIIIAPIIPSDGVLPVRWCKKMASADAQWTSGRTNQTGKLRLSQAAWPIDRNIYFRDVFFGLAAWTNTAKKGKPYEFAQVPFEVTVRGNWLGTLVLKVDHALHRVADQDNVPTVLSWGPQIGSILRSSSHIDDWDLIERDVAGAFKLTIQQSRPAWAPGKPSR